MCPNTIPCRTMKWHFSQLRTRFTLTHRLSTSSRFAKHASKLPPQTEKSSIKTSIIPSRKSANIAIMHLWKVAGALQSPKGIRLHYKKKGLLPRPRNRGYMQNNRGVTLRPRFGHGNPTVEYAAVA